MENKPLLSNFYKHVYIYSNKVKTEVLNSIVAKNEKALFVLSTKESVNNLNDIHLQKRLAKLNRDEITHKNSEPFNNNEILVTNIMNSSLRGSNAYKEVDHIILQCGYYGYMLEIESYDFITKLIKNTQFNEYHLLDLCKQTIGRGMRGKTNKILYIQQTKHNQELIKWIKDNMDTNNISFVPSLNTLVNKKTIYFKNKGKKVQQAFNDLYYQCIDLHDNNVISDNELNNIYNRLRGLRNIDSLVYQEIKEHIENLINLNREVVNEL